MQISDYFLDFTSILLNSHHNCAAVMPTMVFHICADGTRAPVPADGCCPSLAAYKTASRFFLYMLININNVIYL